MILVSFFRHCIINTDDFMFFFFLSKENKKQTEQTNDTFSARMKLQILQNLELSIHNIHIVYEDKTTKPNHPFAFGITLNSITFQVERFIFSHKNIYFGISYRQ